MLAFESGELDQLENNQFEYILFNTDNNSIGN